MKRVRIYQAPRSWVISKEDPRSARSLASFLKRHDTDVVNLSRPTEYITLARLASTKKFIGLFQYIALDGRVSPLGTWVLPSERRKGVASGMWKHCFRRHASKHSIIDMCTVTRAGTSFVRSMQRVHKDKQIHSRIHHR